MSDRLWMQAAALALLGAGAAHAAETPYSTMAPLAQYQAPSRADEIAMARSAAPPAISADADILVLGARGYEVAVNGKNGFACIVERAWANDFGNAEFWNPKVRSPICFNPAAARTVLPTFLMRTEWVLAGATPAQMIEKTKAARAARTIRPPEPGAMCYMMSKAGYLSDETHHWQPHLMFFVPVTDAATWGANLPGVPVIGGGGGEFEPLSLFMAPVQVWSDGTPAPGMKK